MDSLFNRENEVGYYHPFWGNQTVEYFGEARKLEHELDVVNGKLVHKGGVKAGTPFDTKDAFNDNSLDESAIFVMTPEGKMFASKSPERGSIHHSSLASGKPVASAGEMIVHDGKLIEVSNGSGHYEPSQSMNDQLFDELKERGVKDKDLAYTYRSGFDEKGDEFFDLQQNRSNIKPDQIPDDWMDE